MKTDLLNIRNMDCMKLMEEYPDNHFDLAVVDPPYGINVSVSMGRRKGDKKSDYHKFAGGDTDAPPVEYFKELKRVSQNQIIWGANHFIERMPWNSAKWLMWDKGFSDKVTFAQFEMAWTSLKGTCKKFDGNPNAQDRIHPTQKPIKLYDWIFTNYAEKGMKILDTHMGSGSIAIASHYAGMNLTACELDEDYYKKAVDRIERETAQQTLFA